MVTAAPTSMAYPIRSSTSIAATIASTTAHRGPCERAFARRRSVAGFDAVTRRLTVRHVRDIPHPTTSADRGLVLVVPYRLCDLLYGPCGFVCDQFL